MRDAMHARANYLCDIMDREAAAAALDATEAKTAGSGLKMDLKFSLIRWVDRNGAEKEGGGAERQKALHISSPLHSMPEPLPPSFPVTSPLAPCRLDISLARWSDVEAGIHRAKLLCEKGGDWERKNKLKVYEAVSLMASRRFKQAADLFLDAIPTFTA